MVYHPAPQRDRPQVGAGPGPGASPGPRTGGWKAKKKHSASWCYKNETFTLAVGIHISKADDRQADLKDYENAKIVALSNLAISNTKFVFALSSLSLISKVFNWFSSLKLLEDNVHGAQFQAGEKRTTVP